MPVPPAGTPGYYGGQPPALPQAYRNAAPGTVISSGRGPRLVVGQNGTTTPAPKKSSAEASPIYYSLTHAATDPYASQKANEAWLYSGLQKTRQAPQADLTQANQQIAQANQQLAGAGNDLNSARIGIVGGVNRLNQAGDLAPQQQALANQYQAAALGNSPSVAELAMQRASAAEAHRNLAMAAGVGGPGAVSALINAQNRNATAQGELQQNLGVQRAAEIAQAREGLGNTLGTMRQQTGGEAGLYGNLAGQAGNLAQTGGGLAATSGGLGQISGQQALANAALQGQQNVLNQQGEQFYYGQGANWIQQQAGLNTQLATNHNNYVTGQQALINQANQNANARTDNYIGAGLEAAGGIAATVLTGGAAAPLGAAAVGDATRRVASDIRAKTAIAPAGGEISDAYRGIARANREADAIRGTHVAYPGIRGSGAVPYTPTGVARPFAPGEYVDNNDGSWSSELSMTVKDPNFNGGRASVIPSLWIKDGKPYRARDEREAIQLARASGVPFKSYDNLRDADRASVEREKHWQHVTPETSGQVAPLWNQSPLAQTSSSSYFYKDPNKPGAEPGQHFGPMAQELERTPAGASVVRTMPDGTKGIDTGRLALLNASETGQLRREVDALKTGAVGAKVDPGAQADRLRAANDRREASLNALGANTTTTGAANSGATAVKPVTTVTKTTSPSKGMSQAKKKALAGLVLQGSKELGDTLRNQTPVSYVNPYIHQTLPPQMMPIAAPPALALPQYAPPLPSYYYGGG